MTETVKPAHKRGGKREGPATARNASALLVNPLDSQHIVGVEGITLPGGVPASDLAKVSGSLAVGFTSPKRMLAMASAPRMPGYQASIAALTWPIQGMVTAPPVSSTTMVCGVAAATALASAS